MSPQNNLISPDQITLVCLGYSDKQLRKDIAFAISMILRSSECNVSRIIITGGDPYDNGISEAKLIKQQIRSRGSLVEIILEEESINTHENATNVAELALQDSPMISILGESSHLKRAENDFVNQGFTVTNTVSVQETLQEGIRAMGYTKKFNHFTKRHTLRYIQERLFFLKGVVPQKYIDMLKKIAFPGKDSTH